MDNESENDMNNIEISEELYRNEYDNNAMELII